MIQNNIPQTATAILTNINNSNKKDIPNLLKNTDGRVKTLLFYSLHPKVEWLLPKNPDGDKLNDVLGVTADKRRSISELDASTPLFLNEVRKFYTFCRRPNDRLSQARRETLFLQMLNDVHPDDAQLLLNIKDGMWPFKNISLEVCLKSIPEHFPNIDN